MYYALTRKGYDKVEAGLPYKPSLYYSTLGAVADLEERYEGTRAIRDLEIFRLMKPSPEKSVRLALNKLVRNGLIETTNREGGKYELLYINTEG